MILRQTRAIGSCSKFAGQLPRKSYFFHNDLNAIIFEIVITGVEEDVFLNSFFFICISDESCDWVMSLL